MLNLTHNKRKTKPVFSLPLRFSGLPEKLLACLGNVIVTLGLALMTGWLCAQAGLPAPWLIGSLLGTWLIGGQLPFLRPRMTMPRQLHIPVVLGLSVLMGANFTPQLAERAQDWLPTAAAMIAVTIFASFAGVAFLMHRRGYCLSMAWLCALPGGQAEVTVIAREMVEKDFVVALFHLVRVSFVFMLVPLLLGITGSDDAAISSAKILEGMPRIMDMPLASMLVFIGIALSGYGGGVMLALPMPHLLGPLFVSTALHVSGFIVIPRLGEFVLLAQLVIGGGVGARLAQVPFRSLSGYIKDALMTAALSVSIYSIMAWLISLGLGKPFLDMLLAFIPGGIYEVSLLALIFGLDVGFVAFHHTLRVMLIFFTLPAMVGFMNRHAGKRKNK